MSRKRSAYFDALTDRLDMIGDFGSNQTTWERINKTRQQENKARDASLAWQQAQVDAAKRGATSQAGIAGNIQQGPVSNASIGTVGGKRPSSAIQEFIDSIGAKESGGNYGAVNKHSGALGKYQIIPSNLNGVKKGWDYEALGRDVTTAQYLNSPELQEQIASYKLQQYYSKYGPAGAAIAWYAGPGAADKYLKTGKISGAAQANNYPSIQQYVNSVTGGRM